MSLVSHLANATVDFYKSKSNRIKSVMIWQIMALFMLQSWYPLYRETVTEAMLQAVPQHDAQLNIWVFLIVYLVTCAVIFARFLRNLNKL